MGLENSVNMVFSVSAWCGWVQQSSGEPMVTSSSISCSQAPEVSSIPPMLRRRLNTLGRAAASQLLALLKEGENIAMVYCSSHGDIERTLGVLKELAAEIPVSPKHFSLTVHNAVPGILSIHSGLTAAISSIAASDGGLVPTLLEAAGMLSDQCHKVICIIGDVRLPDIYWRPEYQPEQSFAACFILSTGDGVKLSMNYSGPSDAEHLEEIPCSLRFAEFLDSEQPSILLKHNQGYWQISK